MERLLIEFLEWGMAQWMLWGGCNDGRFEILGWVFERREMHLDTVGLSGDCFGDSFHRSDRFGGFLCWIFSQNSEAWILRARPF